MRERKGPGLLSARKEAARAALCVRGRGQGGSVRGIKGPELCARDERARAAMYAKLKGQSDSVREMKGPGQLCARDEGFLPQLFYRNFTFLTFLRKVRNVRNVKLR